MVYEGIINGMKKQILKKLFKGRFVFARKNPAETPMSADNIVVILARIRLFAIIFTYLPVKRISL